MSRDEHQAKQRARAFPRINTVQAARCVNAMMHSRAKLEKCHAHHFAEAVDYVLDLHEASVTFRIGV
jgi:hypothetical protein